MHHHKTAAQTAIARARNPRVEHACNANVDLRHAGLQGFSKCSQPVSRRAFLAGAAALMGVSALGLTGCNVVNTQSELKTLVIGCDSYPPANYLDENGDPAGFDVDIAKEALGRIGYEPSFKYINWEDKNDLLAAGEIDCIAGCFTMTGREKDYRWAGPYLRSRQVVAVDPTSSIYTLADLEDKVVAVQTTTKPEGIFLNRTKEGLPQVRKVYSFADRSLLYPSLSKGYVDAIAAHEMSIMQYEKDYGVEYRILDESLLEVGLGFAFHLDDKSGIAEKLDTVFEEMLADGSMEKIAANYSDNAAYLTEVDGLVSE